jgi:hypothetical protein
MHRPEVSVVASLCDMFPKIGLPLSLLLLTELFELATDVQQFLLGLFGGCFEAMSDLRQTVQ